MRSKYKGPYIIVKNFEKKRSIPIMARNVKIMSQFLGFTFSVYNGKTYKKITVNSSMFGHKFGEFVFTREKFSFKKNKKK